MGALTSQFREMKSEVVIKQESATNAATLTSDNIDTLGADLIAIEVIATTSNSGATNPSVLKVQESATTDASNFADITALVGDGTGGFTVPNSPTATTTAPFALLLCDTRYLKRYLRVLISPTTTQTFCVVAHHGLREQATANTTDQNYAVIAAG